MLLIHTALAAEARPLRRHFNLRGMASAGSFRFYGNGEVFLVVSGVGHLRAAAAVGLALGKMTGEQRPPTALLNFGTCGAVSNRYPLGSSFLIRKLTEGVEGRCFYPDLCFQHNLSEAELATVSRVLESPRDLGDQGLPVDYDGLVDMEASGVFQTGMFVLPPSRVLSLKVVGDHLSGARSVQADWVEKMGEGAIPALEGLLNSGWPWRLAPENLRPATAMEHQPLLDQVQAVLRLTATQKIRLNQAVAYAAKSGSGNSTLAAVMVEFLQVRVTHKREQRGHFEELLRRILASF